MERFEGWMERFNSQTVPEPRPPPASNPSSPPASNHYNDPIGDKYGHNKKEILFPFKRCPEQMKMMEEKENPILQYPDIHAISASTRQLLPDILGNIYSQFMKVSAMFATSATTSQQQRVVLQNIYDPFMKECIIPVISVTTRQLLTVILGRINDQFMKECGIPVVSANSKQLVKDILGILPLVISLWTPLSRKTHKMTKERQNSPILTKNAKRATDLTKNTSTIR